jgi:hypothetical protein
VQCRHDPKWERIQREGGERGKLLVLHLEAEVPRVEIDGTTDVRDLRANPVKAADETFGPRVCFLATSGCVVHRLPLPSEYSGGDFAPLTLAGAAARWKNLRAC